VTVAAPGAAHTVEIDGATIHYLRGGNGAPLLFLHGAGGVNGWAPWMDALAAHYDLIVPDHPGWGRSDTPEWFDNIHDLAFFYLDFMDALGLSNVHLVGGSIGGWIACEIAVRNTKHLQTLSLLAPAGLRVIGTPRFDFFLATREELAKHRYFDQALVDREIANAPVGDALDMLLKNNYAAARVAWQPRFYDPHLAKWLHRIDVPTLVLWGENDTFFPISLQAEFVRLIPGARAATIPRCGHLPHIECPDAVAEALTHFIDGAVL
jgi:pimeloyl-ACP methyl ester carboxylesterase